MLISINDYLCLCFLWLVNVLVYHIFFYLVYAMSCHKKNITNDLVASDCDIRLYQTVSDAQRQQLLLGHLHIVCSILCSNVYNWKEIRLSLFSSLKFAFNGQIFLPHWNHIFNNIYAMKCEISFRFCDVFKLLLAYANLICVHCATV